MASTDSTKPMPIAIVGMACRLSGEVSTLDDFWTMLSRSRDGWCEVPEDRYSSKAFYHPSPQKRGAFNIKGGYYMNRDFSKFDAPFFNITKQEATAMDPQQRQLLEVTYEALENAGIPKEKIAGRNMGVYVGGKISDYRQGTLKDINAVPMFDATGNHASILAGRLSYYFDLHGPCFTLDTACSSGLYALNSAVQAIRSGEADSAVVAGATLHLQPDDTVSMSMLGIFNEHGRTYAFDHRAKSGFARGEGIGCLILKPLDQAIKDNDKIRSIIANSGTNQDGKTVGISTPSGEAQEQLMRDVYARAKIDPKEVGYIEAHGTGTKVGDPIEVGALQRVFGEGRTKRSPLYLGSVKTNVGHLENASGIISVIKASLMLEKGFILPNVNFEKANPAIPLDQWNLKVPINIRLWPKDKKYISINNFGFGGSNAHVILERPTPPSLTDLPQERKNETPLLFVVSASDEASAKKTASQLGVYIEQHPEVFQKRLIRDIAYTLGQRRSHLPWRISVTASSLSSLAGALNGVDAIPTRASKVPKIAFVYTGQGAQWATMGIQLMDSHPVFAETMQACEEALQKAGATFSIIEELRKPKEESIVGEPHISQAACTAVQVAMTELLKSWGINPTSVVGHSSGEVCAAYATGAITIQDSMSAAFWRGELASKLKTTHPDLKGGMLAVGKGPEEIKQVIKDLGLEGVTVACENSPASITASGDVEPLDKLAEELESQSVFNRKLRVDVAYHSSHMQIVADDYFEKIKDMAPKETEGVAFYSSLQGKKIASTAELGAQYWIDNLTNPVLFSSSLRDLVNDTQPDVIVEIGPHAALEGPIKQILKGISSQVASGTKYLSALIRNKDASETAVKLAGGLYLNGFIPDFHAINETDPSLQKPALVTDFLPYPWAEHKYWLESRHSKQHRLPPFARHDLLGRLEDTYSDAEPTWRNIITTDDIPWLKDHSMQSLTTFPLAGYMCMAVEAASQRAQLRGIQAEQIDGYRIREVQVSKALIMDEGSDYETVVSLRPYAEGTRSYSDDWDEYRFASWTSSRGWLEHCRCLISVKKVESANAVAPGELEGANLRRAEAEKLTDDDAVELKNFYSELSGRGAGYGPMFQLPADGQLRSSGNYSSSKVVVHDTAASMPQSFEMPSILPTSFMDLFFQLTFPILGAGKGEMPSLFMPSAIKELEISARVPNTVGESVQVYCHGAPDSNNPGPVDFNIDVWHASRTEKPVAKLVGFRMTPVNNDAGEGQVPRPLSYKVDWEPLEVTKAKGKTEELKSGQESPADSGIDVKVEAAAVAEKLKFPEEPIVILSDKDESDELVRELIARIEKRSGVKPSVAPFATAEIGASPYINLTEIDTPIFQDLTADAFDRVQKLLLNSSSMLWVNSGAYKVAQRPENNIAQGVLRTVRSELSKTAATLDLDPESKISASERAELILSALETSLAEPEDDSPVDYEFAEQDGKLVVPRVSEQEDMNLQLFRETQDAEPYLQNFEQEGRRLKIAVGTYGALDSLYWKDEVELPLADDEVEIKVAATGMNFKDVVIAMGQVSSPYLGVECSGTIARVGSKVTTHKAGDRVCSMSLGAYSTYTRCKATSAALIPDDMSFETAASIPVVYSTAYYGIVDLAHLQAGEKILIHAATGGVGQAAIQLSQMIGAEIYATVGSPDKKKLLMETYGIPENRIFYSRNTSFGPAIREATGGEGVDVVINSLAGDLLRETWECLAHFGRFVEIGKRDITSNTRLEMAKFEWNCTFSSVDLTLVAAERPKIMGRVLNAVMGLLSNKTVNPIGPITSVGIEEVETALRKLQSGKTTGKVVVSHKGTDKIKATHPHVKSAIFSPDATYIIIGGTGGLGRSMTKKWVERGARNIVLLSRSGKVTDELQKLIDESKAEGADVHIKACDVGDQASVTALVGEVQKTLPPIRGVIHAAMVLRDVLFEKMTFEEYDQVVRSKVAGGWNFHNALLDTPLDFFVVLSSVAGIVGNRGQAAYAGANTFLDALVQHRVQKGLKATSLNLAAVEGVGYLADGSSGRAAEVLKTIAGTSMVESEVLALLEAAITGKVGSFCGEQCITGLDFSDGTKLPYYAADAKFAHLRDAALAESADANAAAGNATLSIAQELKRAATNEEAVDIVTVGLRDKLGAILMVPTEVMVAQQGNTSVTAFGLDSLNAIELRNWIGKELQSHLQVLELLTSGTLADLAALVLKKTRLEGVWSAKE